MREDSERPRLDVDRKINPNVTAGVTSAVTLDPTRRGGPSPQECGGETQFEGEARQEWQGSCGCATTSYLQGSAFSCTDRANELMHGVLGDGRSREARCRAYVPGRQGYEVAYVSVATLGEAEFVVRGFKVRLMEHYGPFSAAEAMYRLRQVSRRARSQLTETVLAKR